MIMTGGKNVVTLFCCHDRVLPAKVRVPERGLLWLKKNGFSEALNNCAMYISRLYLHAMEIVLL